MESNKNSIQKYLERWRNIHYISFSFDCNDLIDKLMNLHL